MKCELCQVELPTEKCIFALEKRVIDGIEYTFCCIHCADQFEKSKRKRGKSQK
ncbi:MAG: hypothetical protein QXJ68_03455 [Methanocellales archaeon]